MHIFLSLLFPTRHIDTYTHGPKCTVRYLLTVSERSGGRWSFSITSAFRFNLKAKSSVSGIVVPKEFSRGCLRNSKKP